MDKKMINNLKIIYGIDLIVFGLVLACDLLIDKFNFTNYWLLFLLIPSLIDIILNKLNIFNGSVFVLSASIFGAIVFNSPWVSLIVLVILMGILLIFGKNLVKKKEGKRED